jgi:hypothetical protein
MVGGEVAQTLSIAQQSAFNQVMDGSIRILPIVATLARRAASEEFDALVDGAHGPDMIEPFVRQAARRRL